jgi:hypothetical protein
LALTNLLVNQMVVAMFSKYCSEPYTVEPVKIVSEHNKESRETPDLTPREMVASVSFYKCEYAFVLLLSLKKMNH